MVGETQSTRALTQFAQGSLRSHLTLRCWHNTHGCFLRFWDEWDTSGRSDVGEGDETEGLVVRNDIASARRSTLNLYLRQALSREQVYLLRQTTLLALGRI